MSTRARDGGGEPAYTGALGSTRFEAGFLAGQDGVSHRVDLVRGVNAVTDSALATAAQDGTLHRLEDGTYLAVPYLYHDPSERKFALVVPLARAHEELALRAEVLLQLARDTTPVIPAYVREARVVIGMEGLQRYLGERHDTHASLERHSDDRLRERAEGVTRREDEIAAQLEDLDLRSRELESRERELQSRFADLDAREEAVAEEQNAVLANKNALQSRERMLHARSESLDAREHEAQADADDAGVWVRTREMARPSGRETEPIEAEPIDARETDDVESAEPLPDTPAGGVTSPGAGDAGDTLEAEEFDGPGPAATKDVPAEWLARGHDAYAAVVDGEVRMWIRGGASEAGQLAHGGSTLMLQVDPDSALPLAVLSVVGAKHEERIARVVLDVTSPDDRAVLEALARDFRVRLEVVSSAGRGIGSYAVADQCEANAQGALQVLSARQPGAAAARHDEAERLRVHGLSVGQADDLDRAFADEASLAMAPGAAQALRALDALSEPGMLDRFKLAFGVPAARIDSFAKRVILAALRCGVPLPTRMAKRAIDAGISADEKMLVLRALGAYARTCEAGLSAIGQTPNDALRAWRSLVEWAERAGVHVPDATRTAMFALFDPEDPSAEPPPDVRKAPNAEVISAMRDRELLDWADHPAARQAVALELLRRDAAHHGATLARALKLVDEGAATELAAQMVVAGDAVGDAWVELLSSRRTRAAVLAAVAVAVIKLRRGLNPVVQRALSRETVDWRIFAWAAGEFGPALVRAIQRFEDVDVDRLAWIFAHATRAGAGRDVEKCRTSGHGAIAEAATRAIGKVDEAKAYDAALRQGKGETENERWATGLFAKIAGRAEADPSRRGAAAPEGV